MAAVYSDQNATVLWDGRAQSDLYVRLFRSYGVNDNSDYDGVLGILTPTTSIPDDPYVILYYADWMSEDSPSPLEPGVYALHCISPYDVNNPQVLFYDD